MTSLTAAPIFQVVAHARFRRSAFDAVSRGFCRDLTVAQNLRMLGTLFSPSRRTILAKPLAKPAFDN